MSANTSPQNILYEIDREDTAMIARERERGKSLHASVLKGQKDKMRVEKELLDEMRSE